jgi:uncharacterized circularly permuted ATP-grasp superfamily protein
MSSKPPRRPPEHVAVYNGLLEDRALAESSVERFRAGQLARRLTFGDRTVSIAIRPNLLSRERFAAAVWAARSIHGALLRLERALLSEQQLRRELDLGAEEERLALANPGFRSSSPSSRLDSFFADEVRYVEYNAESPAGMAYEDKMAEVFSGLPVLRAFRKRFRLRTLPVRRSQMTTMLRAFRQWRKGEEPVVAIVDWSGLPTAREFELFREYFEERGLRTLIGDPRNLELRRDRLYLDGQPVNLVYRRVLTSELLARGAEAKGLVDAYLSGAACVVNSFRAKLLHKKMSFALLSDDRHAHLYDAGQLAAIERYVPWTRKLAEGSTTRHGERVPDLVEYVARHRSELVLKPNDEYGGKGVTLGWTVDQTAWEDALKEALGSSSVVQEAVEVPREPFPVALEEIELMDLAIDLDPYLFDGRPGGCLTRLSSSALLNVTAGAGSIVPTYLVEGPA